MMSQKCFFLYGFILQSQSRTRDAPTECVQFGLGLFTKSHAMDKKGARELKSYVDPKKHRVFAHMDLFFNHSLQVPAHWYTFGSSVTTTRYNSTIPTGPLFALCWLVRPLFCAFSL